MSEKPSIIKRAPEPATLAGAETLNRTYRGFLNQLVLDLDDKAHLMSLGLTDRQIKNKLLYRSLPREQEDRRLVCEELVGLGHTLKGIPGFFLAEDEQGRAYRSFYGSGVVAPVLSPDGLVTALYDIKTDAYFTSRDLDEGCEPDTAGAFHLSLGQAGVLHGMFPGRGLQTLVIATQGVLNADYASIRLQLNTIGLLDLQDTSKVVEFLMQSPPVLTAVALDPGEAGQDKTTVNKALANIGGELVRAGMPVVRMAWRPESGTTFRELIKTC